MAYTDTFNRANESPIQAPWTANVGGGTFVYAAKLNVNQFAGPAGGGACAAHYQDTFAADQYSKATVGGVGAGSYHYVLVRAAASGGTFYYLRCGSGTTIGLRKIVAGTITTLGSDQAVSYANGDVLELRVVGTVLTGYKNGAAIPGVTATDAAIATGCAGLGSANETATWDGWEGGDVITAPVAPTVTTQAVTDVTDTTATGHGTVTSDGGATVTDRGVCWAETAMPRLAGSHAHALAGGTGAFTADMTGLTPGTHYFVAAFATNSEGTVYGADVEINVATSGTFLAAWAQGSNVILQ